MRCRHAAGKIPEASADCVYLGPYIALLGKMFHRIMIHSTNYFSALVGRKFKDNAMMHDEDNAMIRDKDNAIMHYNAMMRDEDNAMIR